MKVIPELKQKIIEFDQMRSKGPQEIGTIRTDLRNVEHLHHEAKLREFTVTIDEPEKNGGTNTGPNPFGYFLIGAAACFFNQIAKVAIMKDLKVDTLEMTARGHVDLAKVGGHMTDIVYDVRLTGAETKEKLVDMLTEAEGMCFVHQTLKRAIPITANISMNGADVTSHTVGPNSP
ncbi:MAG TPA: OsmC family protein [Nitrososphaerales archaeon]|nr:OsmC family protein [Nitrososphaerales archaeon]